MPDPLNSERWRRALQAAVDRRWLRSRWLLFAAAYALWATFCVALLRAGYPGWRVAALALLLAVAVAAFVRHLLLGRALPEGDGRMPLAVLLLATGLTGGLHSPLLLGATGSYSGFLLRRGWNRETRAALALFLAGAAALAIVPDAWVGPRVPDACYAATAVCVLALSVALHTDYMVLLMTTATHALRQLLCARDEAASQALRRATELERMSAQLSHELKNPLGAIKALVQLSVRSERDADIRARLEVVEGEVERMQAILQGYVSFSRPLDALRPEPVELDALADEVTAVLEARAENAGVTLRRTGTARLHADPRRVKEALLNLVANAIEATPAGGLVEIRIASRDGGAEIAVHDTGRGMPLDVLARVGTPFFTTREQGTGLGVLLARSVFVQHGGRLEYESAPGRGTVATGTLPLTCTEKARNVTCAAGR
jgi:signal transduction histidine kinase